MEQRLYCFLVLEYKWLVKIHALNYILLCHVKKNYCLKKKNLESNIKIGPFCYNNNKKFNLEKMSFAIDIQIDILVLVNKTVHYCA